MEEKKILLLGGGGHALSLIECIIRMEEYSQIGIVDDVKTGTVLGVPVVGTDNDLERLHVEENYNYAIVSIGSLEDQQKRKAKQMLLENIGFVLSNVVDPSALVSENAKLGKGIFIGRNSIVTAFATIGDGVIINTQSVVEHESIIEDFVHIAPGVVFCGAVHIKEGAFIGAGTTIKQNISVGKNSYIGLGSVIISDIKDNVLAYGNPCKVIRER